MKTIKNDRWRICISLPSDGWYHPTTDDRDLAYKIIKEAHDTFLARIKAAPDVVQASIQDIVNGPHPGYVQDQGYTTFHYDYDIRYKLKHIHVEYRAMFYVEPGHDEHLVEAGDDLGIVFSHNNIIDYIL